MWRALWGRQIFTLGVTVSHCWAMQGERSVEKTWLFANYILGEMQHLPELAQPPHGLYIILFLNVF